MPRVAAKEIESARKNLGNEIAKCRGETTSQRKLAGAVGLPPSNMKYIEDGVNAPSADIYEKLIAFLQPKPKQRKKMDHLYGILRGTPPPDVCKVMIKNEAISDAIRLLDGQMLNETQLESLKSLFASFVEENGKGVTEDG